MSQLYRQSAAEEKLVQANNEITSLRHTNMALAIFTTAAQEWFGDFPPKLNERLNVLVQTKARKYPPPPVERILDDVKAVIADYRAQENRKRVVL